MLAPDKKRFLLERACQHGHLDYGDLINACREGNAQFFDTENGSAITAIVNSGPHKVLYVMVMGANQAGMKELRDKVLEFAATMGIRYVQMKGRKGFEKARDKRYSDAMEGFKPIGVIYEFDLEKDKP